MQAKKTAYLFDTDLSTKKYLLNEMFTRVQENGYQNKNGKTHYNDVSEKKVVEKRRYKGATDER